MQRFKGLKGGIKHDNLTVATKNSGYLFNQQIVNL